MRVTKTATTSTDTKITVTYHSSMIDLSADGDIYGQKMVGSMDSLVIEKNENVILTAYNNMMTMSTTYPNMPKGAHGMVRGYNAEKKEIIQAVSKEVYELIVSLIADAKDESEQDCIKPEIKKVDDTYVDSHGFGWCEKCSSYCYGDCQV